MKRHARRLAAQFAPGRLGGQTVITFALKIWTAAASFAFSWLVARRFGAAGSGQIGIAVTTLTILCFLVLAGIDVAAVRVAAGDLREGDRAGARGAIRAGARAVLVAAPALIAVLWLARDWIAARVLHQPQLTAILGIMLWVTVPLALQRMASAALRASGRVIASQWFDGPVGTTLSLLGLAAAVLLGQATLALAAWVYLGGVAVACLIAWWWLERVFGDWPAATPVATWPLVVAGLPILASNLSGLFTEWFTTVSLGAARSIVEVGQYRVAWQCVAVAGLVQIAMDTIVGPRIAAAARVGATDEIAAVARRSLLLALGLAAPLFVVLLAFPATLLGVFGPEFRGGALALQLLAAGQLVRLASGPLGSILVMTGNQRWILGYAALGVVACVGFVAWLVPLYGAVGAALATSATVALRTVAAGLVVRYALGIRLFGRNG